MAVLLSLQQKTCFGETKMIPVPVPARDIVLPQMVIQMTVVVFRWSAALPTVVLAAF